MLAGIRFEQKFLLFWSCRIEYFYLGDSNTKYGYDVDMYNLPMKLVNGDVYTILHIIQYNKPI